MLILSKGYILLEDKKMILALYFFTKFKQFRVPIKFVSIKYLRPFLNPVATDGSAAQSIKKSNFGIFFKSF